MKKLIFFVAMVCSCALSAQQVRITSTKGDVIVVNVSQSNNSAIVVPMASTKPYTMPAATTIRIDGLSRGPYAPRSPQTPQVPQANTTRSNTGNYLMDMNVFQTPAAPVINPSTYIRENSFPNGTFRF